MAVTQVTKQLAGVEDFLIGNGTETQRRNNTNHTITKFTPLHVVNTATDVQDTNHLKITKLITLGNINTTDGKGGVYYWDSTSTAIHDNYDVIKRTNVTIGRWLRTPIAKQANVGSLFELLDTVDPLLSSEAHTNNFYASTIIGGGSYYYWDATQDKANADGGTIIDPDTLNGWTGSSSNILTTYYDPTSGQGSGIGTGCWRLCITDSLTSFQFGIPSGGDAEVPIQAFIKACYDYEVANQVFAPDTIMDIGTSVFWNSYGVLTRSLNIFNMNFSLTAATAGGTIVGVGRGADAGNADTIERTGKLIFHSPRINGNSIVGQNGIGLGRGTDVIIFNPDIQNCKRDYVGTVEGGRGITAHARCKNVSIHNYNVKNCSDAFHVAHNPDYSSGDSGVSAITAITLGVTTTITVVANTFNVGEFVTPYLTAGTTELNPTYSEEAQYEVLSVSGLDVEIDVDSTTFTAWSSGGSLVRSDLTGGGKSPAISVNGMIAEDCEYSLINIEGGNWPRSINAYQTVFVDKVVAKNCGTTTTRGLINGSNAQGLQIGKLAVYNDIDHPIQDVFRGSFQCSNLNGVFDIHTLNGAVINADPTVENPAATGVDAGITTYPYATSLDNTYDLKVIYRGNQATIDSLIYTTDLAGSSIDYLFRNKIQIAFSGLANGSSYTGAIQNIGVHYSNRIRVTDLNNGSELEGSFSGGSLNGIGANGAKGVVDAFEIRANTTTASLRALDSTGAIKGRLDYLMSNNRYYVYLNNVSHWQFTTAAITASTDNTQDWMSAGLRGRELFCVNNVINTSDEREKTTIEPLSEIEKAVALKIKACIGKFKWLDSVDKKGNSARIHIGAGAQTVRAIFEANGLDPEQYALFCYDEWENEYDEEGNVILTAGNRYGLRYGELLAFIIAAM